MESKYYILRHSQHRLRLQTSAVVTDDKVQTAIRQKLEAARVSRSQQSDIELEANE